MLVNCWNCGTGFNNKASKHDSCYSCGWTYCPSCGVCAPSCNNRLLISLYNKWLRKNCNICILKGKCRYESFVQDKKYMFDRIDKGTLKDVCKKRLKK